MNLRCNAHGLLPWLGHGECSACGRLYKHILEGPLDCSCGERLLPWRKDRAVALFAAMRGDRANFTARPACAKCFEGMTRSAAVSEGEGDDPLAGGFE